MNERPVDWTGGEPVLLVTSCGRCGDRWYLPHVHCPVCGSTRSTTTPARGGGLCVAVTRLHVTSSDDAGPVSLGLVELDEGPLVMGRVHDDELAAGDRARIHFRPDGAGQALLPSFAREA